MIAPPQEIKELGSFGFDEGQRLNLNLSLMLLRRPILKVELERESRPQCHQDSILLHISRAQSKQRQINLFKITSSGAGGMA